MILQLNTIFNTQCSQVFQSSLYLVVGMFGQLTGVPDVLVPDLHQPLSQVVLRAGCRRAARPPPLVLFEIAHVLYVARQRYLHVTEQRHHLEVLFRSKSYK